MGDVVDKTVKPVVSAQVTPPEKTVDVPVSEEVDAEVASEPEDTPSSDKTNLVPEGDWRTSPLFYEISQFLGVDEKSYEQSAEKIALITDWAINSVGSNKIEDIFGAIRALEDELQPPAWGETRYNNLYKYLRLESKANAFSRALNAFKKNGNK